MIYLDSAATTLEKPDSVANAMRLAVGRLASPGRGGHRASERAAELIFRCREEAAELFHVPSPEQVVFTANATHGLNLAIHALTKSGGTALISGFEHNAVTRPLYGRKNLSVKVAAGALFDPDAVVESFAREMTEEVDFVVCNHVSNVFGFIQPIERIAQLCRQRGKPLIVDASQSAGTLPVNMEKWGADFVAMPGHKGLYGPQGTGLLLCGGETCPLLYGGTGSRSALQYMPDFLPDRLEAGTQNVCGIAGLLAGIRYVKTKGPERILTHERMLSRRMMDAVARIPGVRVFRDDSCQSGLFSFIADGIDCEVLGERLGRKGVAVRAGLHCAPLAHKTAGTADSGTVRVSFSAFNNIRQVFDAVNLIGVAVKEARVR